METAGFKISNFYKPPHLCKTDGAAGATVQEPAFNRQSLKQDQLIIDSEKLLSSLACLDDVRPFVECPEALIAGCGNSLAV